MFEFASWYPRVFCLGITFPFDKVLCAASVSCGFGVEYFLDLVVALFVSDDFWWGFGKVGTMLWCFFVWL